MTTLYPKPIITDKIIYSHITSFEIFKYYCANFKNIGEHFKSELRKDNNASCIIDWIKGDLMYSDFGSGIHVRAIDYIMLKYSLNYYKAIEKIYYEFKLDGNKQNRPYNNWYSHIIINNTSYNSGYKIETDKPTTIRIKRRNWQVCDRYYWRDQYSIQRSTLERYNVSPISHFWINSRRLDNQIFKANELSYSYDFYWENGVFRRKIYQPNSQLNKFYGNGGAVVQGEGMLPYSGDLLIITKSLKDVMVLFELGYTSISPTSETTFLPEQYLLKQKKRFKNIILLYDNDITGVERSKIYSEKWNIPYILIPEEFGIKDISDFVHYKSFDQVKKLIKELL